MDAHLYRLIDLATMLAAFALVGAACFGLGRLLARRLAIAFSPGERVFGCVWLGVALSLLVFQAWHLVAAIDFRAGAVVFGCGLLACAAHARPRWRVLLRRLWTPRIAVFAGVMTVVSVWIARKAMLEPTHYDAGLYYFNAIRWLNEYAVVPGLGNLHGRLAFNQSFLDFVAALNFHPWFGHGHNLAAALLLLVVAAEGVWSLLVVAGPGGPADAGRRSALHVAALSLPAIALIGMRHSLSSSSPDDASFVLQVVIFIHLWRLLTRSRSAFHVAPEARFLLLLAATLLTVKLSNAVFAGCVVLVAAFSVLHLHRPGKGATRRALAVTVALSVAMVSVWLGHGLIVSGYPLYPATIGRIDVDWAMPVEAARWEAVKIASWARDPHNLNYDALEGWEWLEPWWHSLLGGWGVRAVYPFVLGAGFVGLGLAALMRLDVARRRGVLALLGPALLPVGAGLVFWFAAAPDPRFANALFWLFCVSGGAFLLRAAAGAGRAASLAMFALVLGLTASPVVAWLARNPSYLGYVSYTGFQPIPRVSMEPQTTRSGVSILVPAEGSQPWDARLPSAHKLPTDLCMRGESLAFGFRYCGRSVEKAPAAAPSR